MNIRLEIGDSVRINGIWGPYGTLLHHALSDSLASMDVDQLVYNPVYGVITEQVNDVIQSKVREYEYK